MSKYLYILSYVACFGVGAYAWLAKNSGVAPAPAAHPEKAPRVADFSRPALVAQVGKVPITQEDLDWEYRQIVSGINDKESLTAIPDLGERAQQELVPLRRSILTGLVERKLLYSYLQQDQDFAFDNPARYSACLSEWQELAGGTANGTVRERLKERLCERSILAQYLRERLFADIKIDEREVLEYYKNHMGDFKIPERVIIRHILSGNEQDARKWRAQATQHNFADLAKEHSLAPEGGQGGLLGPFARGTMPAVFEVAFHMHKGEISDVLKSNYGYHIIMLVEDQAKQQLSLAEARPKITATLRQRMQHERYGKWVDQALAAINVNVPRVVW